MKQEFKNFQKEAIVAMRNMQKQDADTTAEILSSAVGEQEVNTTTGRTEVVIMDKQQVEELVDYADSAAENIIGQIDEGGAVDPESCFGLAESIGNVNAVFVKSSQQDAERTSDITIQQNQPTTRNSTTNITSGNNKPQSSRNKFKNFQK